MSPKVSVIVPCYNLGRYLDEAVDSVLAQTFRDFEIVVVDDGSTDPETARLLAGYRRAKTRVIHSENRGLPGARNLGIRETSGQYLCHLDADDLLEPSCLARSVEVLDADPSVAFASHWLRAFGDEAWEWTPERCDFPTLLDRNTVNGAALVRREAILAAGLFDESMRRGCEDWDLWITLVERGYRGVIIPEFLFRYRRWAGSMSRRMATGEVGVALYEDLARKHLESYRRHLEELFLRRATVIGDLLAHTYELALEEGRWLGPELQRKREWRATLETRTGRPEPDERGQPAAGDTDLERLVGELRTAWSDARREVDALRGSVSWKVTAPLRAVYDWFWRMRGPRGRGRE